MYVADEHDTLDPEVAGLASQTLHYFPEKNLQEILVDNFEGRSRPLRKATSNDSVHNSYGLRLERDFRYPVQRSNLTALKSGTRGTPIHTTPLTH